MCHANDSTTRSSILQVINVKKSEIVRPRHQDASRNAINLLLGVGPLEMLNGNQGTVSSRVVRKEQSKGIRCWFPVAARTTTKCSSMNGRRRITTEAGGIEMLSVTVTLASPLDLRSV